VVKELSSGCEFKGEVVFCAGLEALIRLCLVSTKLYFQPSIEVYVWPGINGLTSLDQHDVVTVIHSVLDGVDYLTVTLSSSALANLLGFFFLCLVGNLEAAQELKSIHHS